MKYDMSNPEHRARLQAKIDEVKANGHGIVEFKVCKPQRTMPQNRYLHLIISFFAAEYGTTAEFVKEQFFKLAANRAMFLRVKEDKILGHVEYLLSTRDLDTDEMALCIDRFRNWSSMVAGIYLPSSDEQRLLELAELEVSRNEEYL